MSHEPMAGSLSEILDGIWQPIFLPTTNLIYGPSYCKTNLHIPNPTTFTPCFKWIPSNTFTFPVVTCSFPVLRAHVSTEDLTMFMSLSCTCWFCYITLQLWSDARLKTFLPQDISQLYKQAEWCPWTDHIYNFKHVFYFKKKAKIAHQRCYHHTTQFKAPNILETQTRHTS